MADDDMRTWQVLDAPARIYLQAGELTGDTPWSDLFEVTWCQDKVGDHDVEYIRTDLHAAGIERLHARERELQAALAALVTVSTTPDERQWPGQWNDAWHAARTALAAVSAETEEA